MDENIPLSVVEFLRRRGYRVLWIRQSKYVGSEDDVLVELAKKLSAPIITLDKDFGRIYYLWERGKVTIYLIRVKPAIPANIVRILKTFLSKNTFRDFQNCLVILLWDKIRILCLRSRK